jgi:signal transduction histidine kinase
VGFERFVPARAARSGVTDWSLALAVIAVGEFSILSGHTTEGPRGLTAAVALVVGVGLAFRRRAPLEAATVAMCAWLIQAVAGRSPSALWEIVPLLVYPYSVAAHENRRRALIGGAILLAGLWAIVALDPTAHTTTDRLFSAPLFVGASWLAGRGVRRFWSQARELDQLNRELEGRREMDLLAATREERARIARELHDVVAHSLSVIVVQAGAAELMLAQDPQRAAEPLASIRQTGKGALGEMRRLLGVLRTDPDGLALSPQPGVGGLPGLVEQMRDAGLDVRLSPLNELPELPPGPDLVTFRVVQEALTNTLKHAGKVRADVALRAADDVLEIDISDCGRTARRNGAGGHGLIGMRERVALYGGSVSAGPLPSGGWRVHAKLPLQTDSSA